MSHDKQTRIARTIMQICVDARARIPALLLIFCHAAIASPAADLHALINEQWQTATREQVFFRTDPDAWRMHGKLAEFTPQARERRQHYNQSVLHRLAAIDVDGLTSQDRLNYRLFLYEREAELESYEQPFYLFPVTSMFGYQGYFADAPAPGCCCVRWRSR
jgi:uncharacterized protein (DUF885 family)